jgi:hypothetical protein
MLRFILGCACGAVFALVVVIAVAALAALMPGEAKALLAGLMEAVRSL